MSTPFSTCWVVTDGKAGMESQCVGLAEALGLSPVIKQVQLRPLWRALSPYLRMRLAHAFKNKHVLSPPWPDLLIASGRLSVAASLYVRAQSRRDGRPTLTIQIQDPVIAPSYFDLVIAPLHDELRGDNVIRTVGALHRIRAEKLAAAAEALRQRVVPIGPPFIGVLIGGANGVYRMGEQEILALSARLDEFATREGASLIVTPSRRTGDGNIALLGTSLKSERVFLWDGTGENPYFGILGLADRLVVTADSVNMISEAVASGKPVYVYPLPGGSQKSQRFLDTVFARNLARPLRSPIEDYEPVAFNEMETVARAVRERLAAR